MGLVIRRERVEEGAIADPTPLNANDTEMASEHNGRLNRWNIPAGGIGASSIVNAAFLRLTPDPQTASVTIDPDISDWQNDDGTDAIHNVDIVVPEDCVLLCEWSGCWSAGSLVVADCIRFRVTVNGSEVALSGWKSSVYANDQMALSGTTAVNAGPVNIRVDAMVARVGQKYGPSLPAPASSLEVSLFDIYSAASVVFTVGARNLLITERSR